VIGPVDEPRLARDALDLVSIRSWPGQESAVATAYAELLAGTGAAVELDTAVEGSPSVIARLGSGGSRCLQLAGHLDTVPIEHEAPVIRGDQLVGRGACDMKGGLAAIAETLRVLAPAIEELDGSILVTAYGLHEGAGSVPMHAPLRGLLARGVRGDAAIVCEGPKGELPLAGKGSLIFRIAISRPIRDSDHELRVGDTPNPIDAALRVVALLSERVGASLLEHPALGRESVFVGAIHGGDLYNTLPRAVVLEGTRRYPAPRRFDEVRGELEAVCAAVEAATGTTIVLTCERSGQPFDVAAGAAIVGAVRDAHRTVTGRELALGHQLFASDVNHLASDHGIPVAAFGVDPGSGHSNPEHVSLAELADTVRIYADAAVRYLGPR
jgi:acetylornithine deacetylase/succinyl-diaminopimelate desuccinylase